ncbi:MAG: IclR family transcriptional regulator [Burkholderiaceae bacterium]|nr:IclR family transcriptional regulator [Burkholderiaceae bacterium]MDO9088620.1 IclR family transcriptional regulator [Burkholderiaceae bacterium]
MPPRDTPQTPADQRPKPRVQSVARAIDILQAIAQAVGGGVPAKDLAEQLALPRQVVYHLLHTLVDTGMVRKQSRNRYVLGLGVAPIAERFRRQMQSPDLLGEFVEDVARLTGETSYVSGWVGNDIVVRATAPGRIPVHAAEVAIGTGGAAHCRASGKLLVAMLSAEEADRYIASHPLKRMTSKTITTARAFKAELREIQKSWVAMESEEFCEGLACMAVPLGPAPSKLVLAISAPVERFNAMRDSYVAQLKNVAARIRIPRE